MKVRRENLITIAGVVWAIAGMNILIIGISSFWSLNAVDLWIYGLLFLGFIVTLGIFHSMFGKLVKKHVARINGYQDDYKNPLLFFDGKSYAIMAFMIAMGVFLRMSGFVPNWFIAFFYTGLGLALMLAGVGFLMHRAHGPEWSFHKRRSTKQA